MAPSANFSNDPEIIDHTELIEKFKNRVELIVYSQKPLQPIPSTIWDLTQKPIQVLRKGRFDKEIPDW